MVQLGHGLGEKIPTVTEIAANNGNAAYTLLNITNDDEGATGETSQTAQLLFNFKGTINDGSAYSNHEAASIRAYKVSDWFHASDESDHDSGLKFYTTNGGVETLAMTIDNTQAVTFAGALGVGDITISDATPILQYKDTDCGDGDVSASILVAATTTTSDHEDIDVTFMQQVDGTATNFLVSDADGSITIGASGQAIAINSGAVSGITTLGLAGTITNTAGDITLYDDQNNADPYIGLGTSSAEALIIQPVCNSTAKTLDYVLFRSVEAGSTADKGEFRFEVDSSLVCTIDDGGIELKASGTIEAASGDLTINSGWTAAGQTCADLGTVTTADIDGGTVDGITSLTAGGDLDIGAHGFRANTLTADGNTSGRLCVFSTNGLLADATVTESSGALGGITTLGMSGDLTMSGNTVNLTHSGTTSLTITSTSGTVAVEGVTFTGSDISSVGNAITGTKNESLVISVPTQSTDDAVGVGITLQADVGGSGGTGNAGGDVNLTAGNAAGSGDKNGGNIVLTPGDKVNAGADGAVIPNSDNTVDLGKTGTEFKDLFIDGTANIDTLAADAGDVVNDLTVGCLLPDGDTASGDSAAVGYTATEGLILTGQGSSNDVTIKNDADATVLAIPTGTTDVYTVAWTDYTTSSTINGWVNDPPATDAAIYYKVIGKLCYVAFYLDGTSNDTVVNFTLPYTSANTTVVFGCCAINSMDNGGTLTTPQSCRLAANSDIINCYKDTASGAWTNANRKYIYGEFWYEIA